MVEPKLPHRVETRMVVDLRFRRFSPGIAWKGIPKVSVKAPSRFQVLPEFQPNESSTTNLLRNEDKRLYLWDSILN